MLTEEILVSILLPIHNASLYLESCLESLKEQTHKNFEIIAIDDKSTDDSYEILKNFKKKDKRIKVYKNKKHYGLAVCFNRALKKAHGQFVAFMAQDDKSSMHRLRTQLNFLISNPKIAVVGSQCKYMGKKNQPLGKTELPQNHEAILQKLLNGISLQFESVMINKNLLPKDVLKFKKHTYPFIYIDVFLQVLKYGKAANLSQYLHYRRKLKDTSFPTFKHVKSYLKILGKSLVHEDYRLSFRSVFSPLVRGI